MNCVMMQNHFLMVIVILLKKNGNFKTPFESSLDGTKEILFGTQAIFSEGISIDNLSCLILGTPINNEPLLTQLIGRVIRKKDKKLNPVIVDIHLLGNTAKRQASNRVGYYMKQGWEMKYI